MRCPLHTCHEVASGFLFFLGVVLHVSEVDYNKLFVPTSLSAVPLLLILLIGPNWERSNLLVLVMAFCFLSLASYLKKKCHGKPLEMTLYIGRNTLPIYMFHPIFTMAGKFLLPFFRFDGSGIAHAIVVIILSLAGSLLLAKTMDKLHLSWMFGRPKLLRQNKIKKGAQKKTGLPSYASRVVLAL